MKGDIKNVLKDEELRFYFFTVLAAIILITWNLCGSIFNTLGESLRHASFQVSTIITTTGFSTVDFNTWPENAKTILIILMFIGACASSTGGGIKVSRIIICFKMILKEMQTFIHPRSVKCIRTDGHVVDEEVQKAVSAYIMTYIFIFFGSLLILTLDNYSFLTNFTAIAATINNIGPGLELVGPTGNFGFFSILSKYVLMFDMLAGRLELFPLLVLFSPRAWKR